MNYSDANSQLTGRCKESRKLANNTYLRRRENGIAVQLHSTDILLFAPNGNVRVNTGGWNTVTTKDRISRYIPRPWHVWSESGYMFIGNGTQEWNFHTSVWIRGNKTDGITAEKARAGIREARNEAMRPANRARYWIRKARGIFVDRGKCEQKRWNCGTRSRWNARKEANRLQPGEMEKVLTCGCRLFRRAPVSHKLTVDSIMREENAAVRAAQMTIYGVDRFFLDAKPEVMETYQDYSLLTLKFGEWEHARALKMVCPSTGAVYVQTVPPNVSTVALALDWIFDTEDYLKQVQQTT